MRSLAPQRTAEPVAEPASARPRPLNGGPLPPTGPEVPSGAAPRAITRSHGAAPRPRIRVLIMTVMPSPYQRELFAAMAAHPGMDIRVLYYMVSASDRRWGRPALPPYSRILPGLSFDFLARGCCLNPSVVAEVSRGDFDVAIVGDYFTLTAQIAMRCLTRRRIPWVLWSESPGLRSRGPIGRWLRRLAQRPVRRHAAAVAAIGSRAASKYRALLGPGATVFNIPYYCDVRPYLAIRRGWESRPVWSGRPTSDRPVRFLFSGQLIPRKGVDILIRAFESVCERHPRVTLTILGDGPGRDRYRRMVSPEWRPRTRFVGFVQPDGLPRYFAEADVFVLPSRYDGWGVVVNEAVAAGMPVIATSAVGAVSDLVEPGRNGFVVAPADVMGLAAAMRHFADDPGLIASMGRRSRQIAGDWTTASGAERWYAALSHVAARKSPPPPTGT